APLPGQRALMDQGLTDSPSAVAPGLLSYRLPWPAGDAQRGSCDVCLTSRGIDDLREKRMEAAPRPSGDKPAFTDYDYSNFYYGAGEDPLNLLGPFNEWYRDAVPNGYYLYSEPLQSAPSTHVKVRNRKTGEVQDLLNMASYNYLGVSYRPEVVEAAVEATKKFGLGASGSPILSGTFEIHNELAA